jgi:purine-nucleoside phosphorylase
MYKKIDEASTYIKKLLPSIPQIVIILGSCFGELVDELSDRLDIKYSDIPNFPKSSLLTNKRILHYGTLSDKEILILNGRYHYYEGLSSEEIAFPIRVFKNLGINTIIITTAAGGIKDYLEIGDLMLVKDHISLLAPPILSGPNYDRFGPRFLDMSYTYSKELQVITKKVAKTNNINLKEGIFAYYPGPNYETPADIKALRILGADAVSMTLVPEATIAKHCFLDILAICLITNINASILYKQHLDRDEMLEVSHEANKTFITLIKGVLSGLK